MVKRLKKIKRYICNCFAGIRYLNYYKNKYTSNEGCIFLLCTSTNGNIGDQAISYTQRKILETHQKKKVIEVSITEYWNARLFLKKFIKPTDVIFIQGGGNFGIEYWLAEEARRDIIKKFPQCKIISFPQTIDYPNSNEGQLEEMKSQKIYARHKNLHIFARETYSFDKMSELYKSNSIYLTPDIVLLCDIRPNKAIPLNKALLCLRNDCEANLNFNDRKKIEDIVRRVTDFSYTDTCVPRDVSVLEREMEIRDKLNEFAGAKFIITDRLHGMVLSALAGTPCVVFKNYNKKVEGVYQWLKEFPNIVLCDRVDDLEICINKVTVGGIKQFDSNLFEKYFKSLFDIIS